MFLTQLTVLSVRGSTARAVVNPAANQLGLGLMPDVKTYRKIILAQNQQVLFGLCTSVVLHEKMLIFSAWY